VTSKSIRMQREYQARERFERTYSLLLLELEQGAPRRHLDAIVELAEVHLAAAGSSLATTSMRGQLGAVKAAVATRTNLRVVTTAPTPEKAAPDMNNQLEVTAAAECHCGTNLSVSYNPLGRCWQALCEQCYDGTEDAGALSHCHGHGATPDEALSDWLEQHELAADLEVWPHPASLEWLIKVEARRQRGWVEQNGYWGPANAVANHNG
jgi:hypothetical protein